MFAYLSLLVQSGAMDEVNLSFLIAGHTHCPLDQYFSVLGKAIHKANFIGVKRHILFDLHSFSLLMIGLLFVACLFVRA